MAIAGIATAALAATLIYWALHPSAHPTAPKVVVGTRDEIYFMHAATRQEAEALGRSLQATGFFNDRGTTVYFSKGTEGTIVSFALSNGAWDHPGAIQSFEEIGRRVAASTGGFPLQVRLIDGARVTHRELTIGKVSLGRDEVYYFGSATRAEAESLGEALRRVGYLTGAGSSVELSRDPQTAISFVVQEGSWNQPATVRGFEALVRKTAGPVVGLPVDLRLLSSDMEIKKEIRAVK